MIPHHILQQTVIYVTHCAVIVIMIMVFRIFFWHTKKAPHSENPLVKDYD